MICKHMVCLMSGDDDQSGQADMMRVLQLLLPALVPSWKFFKSIQPSPRVQWRLIANAEDTDSQWNEFYLRPDKVSWSETVLRVFWNGQWNEKLFMVSLAERLTAYPNNAGVDEIFRRIKAEIKSRALVDDASNLQFRLLHVFRAGDEIVSEVTFLSAPRLLTEVTD